MKIKLKFKALLLCVALLCSLNSVWAKKAIEIYHTSAGYVPQPNGTLIWEGPINGGPYFYSKQEACNDVLPRAVKKGARLVFSPVNSGEGLAIDYPEALKKPSQYELKVLSVGVFTGSKASSADYCNIKISFAYRYIQGTSEPSIHQYDGPFVIAASCNGLKPSLDDWRLSPGSDCPEPCPVEPLDPITDPDALRFENGDTIRIDKLTPSMQSKLQCLQASGIGSNVTSAWRPQAYQDHLRQIYDRLIMLDKNKTRACDSIRRDIEAEASRHGVAPLLANGFRRPVGRSSNHTSGTAFDASWSSSDSKMTQAARSCGLCRPIPNDRPHFQACN